MQNGNKTKKLCLAGILIAANVGCYLFSIPVGPFKAAPWQHIVNVLAAVLLGPWYGVAMAFLASVLRNLLGLGTVFAFPGSMFGALLAGLAYWKAPKLWAAFAGELFGTGVLGALGAYAVAALFMGKPAADANAVFAGYIFPFALASAIGAAIAAVVLLALRKTKFLKWGK
jgi:energy coupling factor transporter S component ThiW